MTTEKKREKLTINTATWLHREGGGTSSLFRATDGKRCCLGFYLQDNCGVSPAQLQGFSSPDMLPASLRRTLPAWLIMSGSDYNTPLVEKLMTANDERESLEEATREAIRELFAQVNIDVKYVDGDPPCLIK